MSTNNEYLVLRNEKFQIFRTKKNNRFIFVAAENVMLWLNSDNEIEKSCCLSDYGWRAYDYGGSEYREACDILNAIKK